MLRNTVSVSLEILDNIQVPRAAYTCTYPVIPNPLQSPDWSFLLILLLC